MLRDLGIDCKVDVLPGDEQQFSVEPEAGLQCGERGQDVGQVCGSSPHLD